MVLGQQTYDLVRNSVEVRSLGTPDLKGKSVPTEVYELIGLRCRHLTAQTRPGRPELSAVRGRECVELPIGVLRDDVSPFAQTAPMSPGAPLLDVPGAASHHRRRGGWRAGRTRRAELVERVVSGAR